MKSTGSKRLAMLAALLFAARAVCFGAQPVTDAQAEEFARQLESHLVEGDGAFFAKAFDVDAVLRRTMAGHTPPGNWARTVGVFQKGFEQSLTRSLRNVEGSKFLRLKRVGSEQRILMRIQGDEFGLNYHELIVGRDSRGKLKIADAFIYAAGETFSDMLKRQLIPALAHDQKSLVEKLFSEQPDLLKHERDIQRLTKLVTEGKNKEALKVYARLPQSLQNEKFILGMRLKAGAEDPDYLAAITKWRQLYPRDPSIDLISIDFFILRKEYAKALECVDRLDKAVAGDPYLDYQRANIYLLMKDSAKARASARRAFDREPGLLEAGFFEVAILGEEAKYDECIAVLNHMVAKSGYAKDQLAAGIAAEQLGGGLAQSEVYRKWLGGKSLPSAGRAAVKGDLKLQGVMYSGARSSATINGEFVMIGDKVADHQVVAIEQSSVTLQSPAGVKKVLQLEGDGQR